MKGAGNAARAVILLCKLLARLLARLPGGHGKDPADLGWRSLRDSPEKSVHPADLAVCGWRLP